MLDVLTVATELGISRSEQWGWVALGYAVMYGSLASYVGWITFRVRRARRHLQELQ